MTQDPYSILGITRNASNDEVKKAYRELSRKYHPDSHMDNPLSKLAEDKFKEIQDAYDLIMKEREGGFASANSDYNYTSSQHDDPQLNTVYSHLNSRKYMEALQVLSHIPNRNAKWHYCSAIANAGIGNNIAALNHANQAANMEPNNMDYRNLVNQLQLNSQRYQTGSMRNNNPMSTGNLCCDLFILDSCCECMGGDLCSCM